MPLFSSSSPFDQDVGKLRRIFVGSLSQNDITLMTARAL